MENPSVSTDCLDKLKKWMVGCCWMGASSDSKDVPPSVCESRHATTSSTTSFSYKGSKNLIIKRKTESVEGIGVEDEIQRSKVHWSQLIEHNNEDQEVAEVNNVEVFKFLQRHPTWGQFFCTFGDGGIYDAGELVVGEKFAKGGQVELYHACITWKNPKTNSKDQEQGLMWVLKVFKKGTFLRDLQKQWSLGMFQLYQEINKHVKCGNPRPIKFTCEINCGTLLPDGRFAFLLLRETKDLQTLIDRKMKARTSPNLGPFPMEDVDLIMYVIARGMDWLHNLDIVHRDLKASNVLYTLFNKNSDKELYYFFVANFECSIGVLGTGFFRAPEILQALKDRVVNDRPNLFTKASDVYSYGMVCYEILTGKLPFEGHPKCDFDLVLSGQQLEVPHYVDKWVHDLLQRCWHLNPITRPTFGEILKVLEANSKVCKSLQQRIEEVEMLPLEARMYSAPKYEFEC